MTAISPNVLCQYSFFYLPANFSTPLKLPRFCIRQALAKFALA